MAQQPAETRSRAPSAPTCLPSEFQKYLLRPVSPIFTENQPAKSKRGREEGDGTEIVINCRKLS